MAEKSKVSAATLSLVLFATALVTFGLSYGLNLILARNLAPEDYGSLVFALRILGMLAAFSLLGTATSSTRFLAKYLQCHTSESAEGFLRWNTRIVLWPFLLSVLVGVLVCVTMFCLDFIDSRSIDSYHLSVYMLWIAPLTAAGLLFGAYILCANRPVVSTLLSQLLPLGLQVALFSVLLFVLYAEPTKLLIVGVLAASALVVAIVELTYLRSRTSIRLRNLWPFRKKRSLPEEPEWLRASLWLIFGQSFFQLTTLVDVTLLELAPGREKELGYYGAVLAIVSVLFLVPQATLKPLAAKISSLLETPENRRELQGELNHATRTNTLLALVLVGGILGFSQELLASFGPSYTVAQPTLVIAGGASFLTVLGRAPIAVIARSDMEKRLLVVAGSDLAVLTVVGALLVGPFGMMGVAIALLCSSAVRLTVAVVSVRRRYGLKPLGIL